MRQHHVGVTSACLLLIACGSSGDDEQSGAVGGGPNELLAIDGFLSQLEADDAKLYFQAMSGIRTMPLAGGAHEELASTTGEAAALDADSLWLARGSNGVGQIIRIAKSDGSQQVIVDAQLYPNSIAVDDTQIFWTNRSTYQVSPPDGNLMSANKDGSALTVLVPALAEPNYVALDADYVYFTSGAENGTVSRVKRNGTSLEDLAPGRVWPKDIRVGGAAVYWFDDAAGSSQRADTSPLLRLDLITAKLEVLHQDDVRPHSIALDGDYLYWTAQNSGDCNTNPNYVDGVVRRMPVRGGTVQTLAAHLRDANDIVVQGDTVYWAQSLAGCGAIYSLRKP
jgi:hypothetical protein